MKHDEVESESSFRRVFVVVRMPGIVFRGQHGGADFFLATLLADNVDQAAAGELQFILLAEFVESFQVDAGHVKSSVFFEDGRPATQVQLVTVFAPAP